MTAVRLSFATIPQIMKITVIAAAGMKTPQSTLDRRLASDSASAATAGPEVSRLLTMNPPGP